MKNILYSIRTSGFSNPNFESNNVYYTSSGQFEQLQGQVDQVILNTIGIDILQSYCLYIDCISGD
jgi:hypothetical protein